MEHDLQRELARLQSEFGITPELDERGRLHVTHAQLAALHAADADRADEQRGLARYGPVEVVVDR